MIDEVVPAALDGERLDRVVAIVTGASRADAAVLVAAGGAEVDGAVVTSGKLRLRDGQVLRVHPAKLPQIAAPAADAEYLVPRRKPRKPEQLQSVKTRFQKADPERNDWFPGRSNIDIFLWKEPGLSARDNNIRAAQRMNAACWPITAGAPPETQDLAIQTSPIAAACSQNWQDRWVVAPSVAFLMIF